MRSVLLFIFFLFGSVQAQHLWKAPNYEGQEEVLGHQENLFAIPASLRERVNFWIDIYSKYSTSTGLLHDSRYVHLIYQEVDFSDILESSVLSRWEKYRRQAKRVRNAKREVKKRLRYLHSVKDPSVLQGEDLRLWNLFSNIDEPNKFLKASFRNRLRFQLGQRDQIIQGIFYSGRYLAEMEEIFRQEGLPIQLTRLPFVESSFNIHARSKVGASGIWQFMRSTAKYRLRISSSVDERNDAILSTKASARFLRRNYEMLESWPLAITGYNHGPNGMRRLAERYQTKDLATLIDVVKKRNFGFASRNFYACFLAIVHIERQANLYYGKELPKDKPIYRELVKLPEAFSWQDLLKYFNYDSKLARKYNPHIKKPVRRGWTRLAKRDRVFVPVGRKLELFEDLKVAHLKKKVIEINQNVVEEFSTRLGLPQSYSSELLQRPSVEI